MKVSVISYVYWPEYFLINELTESLALKGHDVKVSTSLPNYQNGRFATGYSLRGPYQEQHSNVNIFRYPVIPRGKSFYFLALNYLTNIVMGFFNLFRMMRTDVYFAFSVGPIINVIPAVILKKITRKPLVVWYQDLWPDSFFAVTKKSDQGFVGLVLKKVVQFIYNNTDVMLVQNPMFIDNLNQLGYTGKVHTVYNWAPAFSEKTVEKLEWMESIPQNKFTITFAGNMGKVQGLSSVIEAARKIEKIDKTILFVFVGDGSYLEEVKKQAAGLSNVFFAGRRPLSDMPVLFQNSGALLVSLAKEKTFSLVVPSKIQAYMSSGKPLLGFLDGAGAQVVRESDCGLVAPAEDVDAFVQIVFDMKNKTSDQLADYGRNGKIFFEQHFESAKNIQFIENILVKTIRDYRV